MFRRLTPFLFVSVMCVFGLLYGEKADSNVRIEGKVCFKTEDILRGALKAKRGVEPHALLIIKNEKRGVYAETCAFLPTQYKQKFGDRWSFSAGYLQKITEFFTWDVGGQYNLLRRAPKDQLSYWRELYTGIKADLPLNPSFYLYHDLERRQWCVEIQCAHDFDLFDSDKWALESLFSWGYVKAKRPFGGVRSGAWNRKNHYWYTSLQLLLAYHVNDELCIKMGPQFTYNRDGTRPYSIANEATHHSHLCSFSMGISYRY